MKSLLSKILSFIGLGITILFAFIFAFIELRSLFAGDFVLFNNPAIGFFNYLFRGLFFLGLVALAVFLIIYIAKKKEGYLGLLILGGTLFVSSFFGLFFYTWYIALLIAVISLNPLLISLFNLLKENEKQ